MFPKVRLRRLRINPAIRKILTQTKLSIDDLIMPVFVIYGKNKKIPVKSMPGIFQLSIDNLLKEVKEIFNLGIKSIIIFGIPQKKDELGSDAYNKNGIIQKTVRVIKEKFPDIVVITDLCFCEYTSHGHCGIIKWGRKGIWQLDNDTTLDIIAKTAISQAQSGSDIIAPSGMIDGQVKTIRQALDEEGFKDKLILSYSAKYASAFYGPFRDAASSAPQFGDRLSYQMNPANSNEALREIELDIKEGADMVMVKPALSYLDIVRLAKEKFNIPLVAYNVSGEYSMVKASASKGFLDEKKIVLEILTSIKRAGADLIISYHSKEVVKYFC